jgi:hypothetical protein
VEERSSSFTPGFDPREAETLVAIDAALEGPTPPLAVPVIPANWHLEFDSPVLGVTDQKWQLWKNTEAEGQYAIAIRGTVDTVGSVVEDLVSLMIPAKGTMTVGGWKFSYTLAEEPCASVHLGFTIGLGILLFDGKDGILVQLLERMGEIKDVFITGHSQGASIATLLRSYFEYSELTKALGLQFKTYVFAQAKPGNDHYAYDLETIAGNQGFAFRVSNSQDWVPQSPLTLQFPGDLNDPNPLSVLEEKVSGLVGKILGAIRRWIGKLLGGLISWSNSSLSRPLGALEKEGHLPEKLSRRLMEKETPSLKHLAAILEKQDSLPVEKLTGRRDDIKIVHSLNFVGAGPAIALRGTPGTNPDDPADFFWQHHAAQYYDLLLKTFPQ